MPSSVRYRETLRAQRSTVRRLVGVVAASMAPLAVALWVFWRPLGGVFVALAVAAIAVAVWLTRWQLQVRTDGLYYRIVPLVPVWRPLSSASETVDVSVERSADGRRSMGEAGALVPWSTGKRMVAAEAEGGVVVSQAGGTEVFVSSRSPDELASAIRSVAR